MIDKIKELQNKGLSIRSIAEELNIGRDKVFRLLKEIGQPESDSTESDNKPVKVSEIVGQNRTESQDNETDFKENVTSETDTLTKIPEKVRIRYPNLLIEDYKAGNYNRLGVKKLRKSDYTPKELKIFPDAPYFNDE